jgi:hypothetical protein
MSVENAAYEWIRSYIPLGPDDALGGSSPTLCPGVQRVRAFAVSAGISISIIRLEESSTCSEEVVRCYQVGDDRWDAFGGSTMIVDY